MDKLNDLFTKIITKLNKKVDSVEGKQLSSEDFTSGEKTKLQGIADEAQVNTIETISLNGTPVPPDEAKNVEIKAYNEDNKPEVGGRNLLLNSGTVISNSDRLTATYIIADNTLKNDEKVVCTIKGEIGEGENNEYFMLYNTDGYNLIGYCHRQADGCYRFYGTWKAQATGNERLLVYCGWTTPTTNTTIEWIKLERGEIATDWSPAPEDIEAKIEDIQMGGTNLFGFNKGIWFDTVLSHPIIGKLEKSIKGLSFEYETDNEHSHNCRLRNLGFDGVSGYYTASFNVYSSKDIDINITVCDGDSILIASSATPKKFVYTGKVTRYNDKSGFNGFIDFSIPPSSESGAIYIENLKIERGNKPTDWSPAPEDLMPVQTTIFDLCPDGIMHRNLFRGKNLGDQVTAEQLAAIKNGTFKDLFIGDYWVIEGVTWLIADMDYFYQAGDAAFTKHHLVIIPQGNLYNAQMNSTNTTEGGYGGSEMYKTGLENAKTKIKAAFGDMVQTHRDILINATTEGHPSGYIWTDSKVELMTEVMVYGTYHYAVMNPGSYLPTKYTTARQQFAIFALNPYYAFIGRIWYWLRDVVSATRFADCGRDGAATCHDASDSHGVRPYFCIGSNEADADMPVEGPEMMDGYMQSDEALSPEFEKPIDRSPETEDEPLTE